MTNTSRPMWYRKLQVAKHRAFLVFKSARLAARRLRVKSRDLALIAAGAVRRYTFDPERFPGSWVANDATEMPFKNQQVPSVLTMFWVGGGQMSENRVRGVQSVRTLNPGLKVRLITDSSVESILVPGFPLHPAYQHLALTHKSDYLRCYVMHHHGGGYCDVKAIRDSWEPAFRRIERNPNVWALGYRELSYATATELPGAIQEDVRRNFFRVIGNGAFIMRAHTPLTAEWFAELNRRLDHWAPELARHPGGVRGGEEGGDYPIPKHALLGDILGPIGLKYHQHLLQDETIRPGFHDYI